MTNNKLCEIAAALKRANTVLVATHVRPDGDALGSAFALCLALENAGKRAFCMLETPPTERLTLFPYMHKYCTALPLKLSEFDLFVTLDCADAERIGAAGSQFAAFKGETVNIDHHFLNPGFAKYNYVVADAAATCEILPEVMEAADFEITKDIADLLTLGLLTDTGNFSHNDVSAKTFAVASKLVEKGADVCGIGYDVFTRQSKGRAILYSRVLKSMRFALDDKLVFMTVTQKDFAETGTVVGDTEGFVNYPLSIEGVEVSASIMEMRPNQYKISLRSKSVNVSAVAGVFGGGGHVNASGCMLCCDFEEVIDRVTHAVYQHL